MQQSGEAPDEAGATEGREALREAERERVGRNAQPSAAIMDATSASRPSRNLPGSVVLMRISA